MVTALDRFAVEDLLRRLRKGLEEIERETRTSGTDFGLPKVAEQARECIDSIDIFTERIGK